MIGRSDYMGVKKNVGRLKKVFVWIAYSGFSIVWLYFMMIFISPVFSESHGYRDWEEDVVFIPIGVVMLVLWLVTLGVMIMDFGKRERS